MSPTNILKDFSNFSHHSNPMITVASHNYRAKNLDLSMQKQSMESIQPSAISPYVLDQIDSELDEFAEKLEQERIYTEQERVYTDEYADPVVAPYEMQIFDQEFAKSGQKSQPSLQKQMNEYQVNPFSNKKIQQSQQKSCSSQKNINSFFMREPKECEQPFKQSLLKLLEEKQFKLQNNSLISYKLLNQIFFNDKNKLLSIIDAGLTDDIFAYLLDSIVMTQKKQQTDKQFHDFIIKGLNLNGNQELTDKSLKLITETLKQFHTIKVLSIERFKVSYNSLTNLFQVLSGTRLIELNVSGIPLNYFCIENLCQNLQNQRDSVDLRVLHIRNTKLQDLSALKLMEYVLGINMVDPIKIKYLSMSMNTQLGFKFQNCVVKMFQEAANPMKQYYLKYLDLKFCNLTKENLSFIQKCILEKNDNCSQVQTFYSKNSKRVNSLNTIQCERSTTRKSPRKSEQPLQVNRSTSNLINKLRKSYEPYFTTNEISEQASSINPLSRMNESQNILEKKLQLSGTQISTAKKIKIQPEVTIKEHECEGFTFQSDRENLNQVTIKKDPNQKKGFNTGIRPQPELKRESRSAIEFIEKQQFSKSCNRQQKSKSFSEIPIGSNNSANKISQNLIQNLYNYELFAGKNKSSQQLIRETVKNIFPKKKNCFDQTFQKINVEESKYNTNDQPSNVYSYQPQIRNINSSAGITSMGSETLFDTNSHNQEDIFGQYVTRHQQSVQPEISRPVLEPKKRKSSASRKKRQNSISQFPVVMLKQSNYPQRSKSACGFQEKKTTGGYTFSKSTISQKHCASAILGLREPINKTTQNQQSRSKSKKSNKSAKRSSVFMPVKDKFQTMQGFWQNKDLSNINKKRKEKLKKPVSKKKKMKENNSLTVNQPKNLCIRDMDMQNKYLRKFHNFSQSKGSNNLNQSCHTGISSSQPWMNTHFMYFPPQQNDPPQYQPEIIEEQKTWNSRKDLTTNSSYNHIPNQPILLEEQIKDYINNNIRLQYNQLLSAATEGGRSQASGASIKTTMPNSKLNSNRGQIMSLADQMSLLRQKQLKNRPYQQIKRDKSLLANIYKKQQQRFQYPIIYNHDDILTGGADCHNISTTNNSMKSEAITRRNISGNTSASQSASLLQQVHSQRLNSKNDLKQSESNLSRVTKYSNQLATPRIYEPELSKNYQNKPNTNQGSDKTVSQVSGRTNTKSCSSINISNKNY